MGMFSYKDWLWSYWMDIFMVSQTQSNSVLSGLVKLARPKQWVKNGFVFAPLVFAGQFGNFASILDVLVVALLFCVGSSATYIVNDYNDIEADRKHPTKSSSRPLASGQVSKTQAIALLGVLYGILALGLFAHTNAVLVIVAYIGLNLAYTFFLKHHAVIDIFTIAIGFVLRVYAGAVVLSVPVSSWMLITTICLALYLAVVKRRQELVQSGKQGRKVLQNYSLALLNRYADTAAISTLLFYSLFVMTARPELIITIPFVLYGLFRYWFIVESFDEGESPTDALFSDWQLMGSVLIWLGICVWTLWPQGI